MGITRSQLQVPLVLLSGAIKTEVLYAKIERAMLNIADAAVALHRIPMENRAWWADRIMFSMLSDRKSVAKYNKLLLG